MNGFFDRNLKYLFPLPAVLFIVALMVFPVLYTLFAGFTDWTLSSDKPMRFVGLQSYIDVFKEPRFRDAVLRTFAFTLGAITVEAVFGTIIALVLNRKFKGKGAALFLLLLPLVAAPVVIGIVFNLFYDPAVGFFNYLLSVLHLPQSGFVTETATVMQSLILVDVWEWTPLITLIVLAGLAGLPAEVFESAKVDGANGFQTFFRVTLPMLMPTILAALALRVVDALKTYDIIFAMTRGGPEYASETLNLYAYKLRFEDFEIGHSAAALAVLFLIVLLFSMGVVKLRNKFEV
jgi:multiple sugar transport system permease protein